MLLKSTVSWSRLASKIRGRRDFKKAKNLIQNRFGTDPVSRYTRTVMWKTKKEERFRPYYPNSWICLLPLADETDQFQSTIQRRTHCALCALL